MLMMIQCAQVSRDGGINPVFIYGVFGGIMAPLHDVGFLGGSVLEGIAGSIGRGGSTTSLVLVRWRPCTFGHHVLHRPRRVPRGARRRLRQRDRASGPRVQRAGTPWLRRGADTSCPAEPASSPNERDVGAISHTRARAFPGSRADVFPASAAPSRDGTAFRDRFSKQMAAVREFYGLSAREAEVAELIARGNTVVHHRRASVRVREHRAYPFQAHLREARRPQTPRAHRPRRALRAGRTLDWPSLSAPAAAPWCSGGAGQAVEGYALGLVDVLLSLLV